MLIGRKQVIHYWYAGAENMESPHCAPKALLYMQANICNQLTNRLKLGEGNKTFQLTLKLAKNCQRCYF